MLYKFDFSFLLEKWPDFLTGAWLTIQLTVLSIALGFVVGTLCAVARVYGGRAVAAAGRRLCRADPQHAAAGPDLHRLFRPVEPRASNSRPRSSAVIALVVNMGAYTTEIMRAGIQSIHAHPTRGGRLPGPDAPSDHPARRAAAGHRARLSRAVEPVRAADAGLVDHLADLGRGADRHRQHRAVRYVPQLRGLHHRRGDLSRAVAALPPGASGPSA